MRSLLPLLILAMTTPACWFDWDEIGYVTPCNPLNPEATCDSPQMRCRPKEAGDPICEGPTHAPNPNGYCKQDDDCGNTEVCLSLQERVPSKICMALCRTDTDCPDGYTCKLGYGMAVRGEAWGGCVMVPPWEWRCDAILYAGWAGGQYTRCDCGCGIFDPDCPDDDPVSCEDCWNESKALCIPTAWTCSDTQWDDGNCDCGCGVIDPGCADNTSESCDQCPTGSCADDYDGGCGTAFDPIRPDHNALCKDPPLSWKCGGTSYFDGHTCDCGCGAVDPDCPDARNTSCEACPEESCGYALGCPKEIFVATDNSLCTE
jgi:hypothetical protein